jgi:hypothetical protein
MERELFSKLAKNSLITEQLRSALTSFCKTLAAQPLLGLTKEILSCWLTSASIIIMNAKGCYFIYLFAVFGSEGKYLVPQYKGVMKKDSSDVQKLETSTKADKRPALDDIPIVVTLNSSSDSDEPKVLFRVGTAMLLFCHPVFYNFLFSCLLGEVVWRGSHQCRI